MMKQGELVMTAIDAGATAHQLQNVDNYMVGTIVNHVLRAYNDLQSLANAGIRRCETLQNEAVAIARSLGSDANISIKLGRGTGIGRLKNTWIKETKSTYERVSKCNSVDAFAKLLANIFAQDKRMPVEMAWALQLIDRVEGVPALLPEQTISSEHSRTGFDTSPANDVQKSRLAA
jgi:hypothetical protein